MTYKAVIFDLDGTLLDTLADLREAVNFALKKQGVASKTLEQIRNYVGNGIAKLIERSVPDGRENPDFETVLESFREYYAVHCQDQTAPYEGILEMLRELKKQKIKMAVVSNKADFAVKELIPVYFQDLIEVAHGENEAAGIRKKPSPDMVNQTLAELGCTADEAVYVGDSDVDLETAANVGMPCIGVSWGFRGRTFLEEKGADCIVDTPDELSRFFKKEE